MLKPTPDARPRGFVQGFPTLKHQFSPLEPGRQSPAAERVQRRGGGRVPQPHAVAHKGGVTAFRPVVVFCGALSFFPLPGQGFRIFSAEIERGGLAGNAAAFALFCAGRAGRAGQAYSRNGLRASSNFFACWTCWTDFCRGGENIKPRHQSHLQRRGHSSACARSRANQKRACACSCGCPQARASPCPAKPKRPACG